MIGARKGGGGQLKVLSIKKSMEDGCGCLEVWRDFFQYFPQECGSRHTLELTEGLGYWVSPVYIYIPFDMLGAIYWLTHTSIDTVQN